jgi:hypothetical protein
MPNFKYDIQNSKRILDFPTKQIVFKDRVGILFPTNT